MKITSTSCICPVLVCLCFVQRCYGTTHHGSIRGTRNQTKHIEGETEVHHRPKRGWVWNQFFVLEEHMGPDPQYVGKVSFCLLFVFSSPGKLWGVIRVELELHLKRMELKWLMLQNVISYSEHFEIMIIKNECDQACHISINISSYILDWIFFTSVSLLLYLM